MHNALIIRGDAKAILKWRQCGTSLFAEKPRLIRGNLSVGSEIRVNCDIIIFSGGFLSVDSSSLYSWIWLARFLNHRIHSIIFKGKNKNDFFFLCFFPPNYSPFDEFVLLFCLSRLNLRTCFSFRIRSSFLAFFV